MYPITLDIIIGGIVVLLLLFVSALISGSEVAFFSFSPQDIDFLKKGKSRKKVVVLKLVEKTDQLLATILITNTFVNISIVILSSYLTNHIFDFSQSKAFGFLFQLVIITFFLLLFGEIMPKLVANYRPRRFALFMAYPLSFIFVLLKPFTKLLTRSTSLFKKLSPPKEQISIDELSHALELTDDSFKREEKILQGIVNFANIEVKGIMRSRQDVVSLNVSENLDEITKKINQYGFSRIPVYQESFDTVKGILFIKDLIPHLHKGKTFHWQLLIRPPYFVHETKKINELLQEFQAEKVHIAIVVDEYGGTSGIVTLEDVLEEIVGEITDEFDKEDVNFEKVNDHKFIFQGKTLLQDFAKVINVNPDIFDEIRGDSDTLAGLILEIKGEFPEQSEMIKFENFIFRIKSIDQRRIKEIIVEIVPNEKTSD
ncbi:MAG: gliding motility-associated protein GldE [Bacteroidales bacterium]|nr:gliding motility-associated protein GldE [Bacteroidales bacterium]